MNHRAAALAKALLAVAAFFPSASPRVLLAQAVSPVAPGDAAQDKDKSVKAFFAAPDRKSLQALERAQKALSENRFADVLEDLAEVQGDNEDRFLQPDRLQSDRLQSDRLQSDRNVGPYKSLKAEAERLLGQMPLEGRQLYEARHGGEAREKLNRALAAGDAALLSEVSTRLFHTQAGYEATYLLALSQMDHGEPLAAARTLDRLRGAWTAQTFEPGLSLTQAACYYQAGMPAECRQVLVDLKRRSGKPALQLSGREMQWFDAASEAPEWLAKATGLERMPPAVESERWTMLRGGAARNAAAVGGAPFMSRTWRVDVAEDPDLKKALREQQASYRDHYITAYSALQPLAVGNVVVTRTATNLLAVDLQTGKPLWRAEDVDAELPTNAKPIRWNATLIGGGVTHLSQEVLYGRRIWEDATYGSLSSDGSRVFAIEGLPLDVGLQNVAMVVADSAASIPIDANALAAYDIPTGKPQWRVGGRKAPALNDVFFLGPPLPLRGQLYVLAEVKAEIRLLALDGDTGKLLWSQPLATAETNVGNDLVRRLAGLSPSYSNGVLVCPTGCGGTVAIDLASRSLLWGHVYGHRNAPPVAQTKMAFRQAANQAAAILNTKGALPRWLDSCPTIVSGKVLLTPADSNALYCMNLADGTPAWPEQPRGEHIYLACVHSGLIVLVGRNTVDAVKLDDGSKAWSCVIDGLPSWAGVCGRGAYVGKNYYLPLENGEVVTIDLETGKIAGRARSYHSEAPGNLVCYRGQVISQGLDALEVYPEGAAARKDAAARLAANVDDIEGLVLRGEVELDEGKFTEAAADFRRAYGLDEKSPVSDPLWLVRTRKLLRDTLLAALQEDFAGNRSVAGELEKLLDDQAQRAAFYRFMETGLERAGDWPQAVSYCLKLVDGEQSKSALEDVDYARLVRRDCWVRARLGTIRDKGGAEAAAKIDRAVDARATEALKDPGVEALRRFLAYFGNQPRASSARAELLKRLTKAGKILDAEILMAAGVEPTDRKAQAVLMADMADLNFHAARIDDAADCFRQLLREYPDVPCHAGATPATWLAAFADGDALRKKVALLDSIWPVGAVEIKDPEAAGPVHLNKHPFSWDMRVGEPVGPFFADRHAMLASNQREIALCDGAGNLQKSTPLTNAGGIIFDPQNTPARSCGHLLFVDTRTKIAALDPTGVADVIWTQDLVEPVPDRGQNSIAPLGSRARGVLSDPFGPVNACYVSFLRNNGLAVADPLSGELLWTRLDIPPGSRVFGDERYLLVLAPDSAEALVYRAADGELLGTRKVPQPGKISGKIPEKISTAVGEGPPAIGFPLPDTGIDFIGRCVLTWRAGGSSEGCELSFFDPWRQEAVWPSRKFASGSCVSVVGGEAVGVWEPSGHFSLIALRDGRTIAEQNLPLRPEFEVTNLLVARMGDQYVVLTGDGRVPANVIDEPLRSPYGLFCHPLRRARVYALDLAGKPAWPAPVDVDHVQFLLNQPARLPLLVFAAFHFEVHVGAGAQTLRTTLVAIDRRNGSIVYDKKTASPLPGYLGAEISGDPRAGSVRILAGNDTVNLLLTSKPAPAAVRHSESVE